MPVNETIFPNIVNVRNNVLQLEKHLLKKRPEVPDIVIKNADFTQPFDPNMADVIHWDSLDYPLTGYYNTASPDRFVMSRLSSGRFSLKPNLKYRSLLFRGQDKFYEQCTPNLFRVKQDPNNSDFYIEEMMRGQELMLLMLRHPMVQLLDMGIDICGRHLQFEMNLYGLTQHYYNKTTLIDLSSDLDVACFFATNKYDPATDTYIPLADGQGVLYAYMLDRSEFNTPRLLRGYALSTIGLQVFPRSGNQRGFLLDMGEGMNFNDIPQVIGFKFKQNLTMSKHFHKIFNGGKLLFPEDILTHHWNTYNKPSKRLSARTLEINHMFNPTKDIVQLKAQIQAKGYTIEDYVVDFTPDELDQYYFSRAEEIWEEFCGIRYISQEIVTVL